MTIKYKTAAGREAPAPEPGSLLYLDRAAAGPRGANANQVPPVQVMVLQTLRMENGSVLLRVAPGTADDADNTKPGEFKVSRREHPSLGRDMKFDMRGIYTIPCVDDIPEAAKKSQLDGLPRFDGVRTLRFIEADYEARRKLDATAERRSYEHVNLDKLRDTIAVAVDEVKRIRKAEFVNAALPQHAHVDPEQAARPGMGALAKITGGSQRLPESEPRVATRPALR